MGTAALVACGGSDGGGETPEQAAENSIAGIANIIEGSGTVPTGGVVECSGTVTGTCAGALYTCSMTTGASEDCECL